MSTKYIHKFASTAAFLAASPDRTNHQGVGYVGDVLYANVDGSAIPIAGLEPTEVLTAARILTAVDSGKTFFLALAGGFAVTLPALLAGFHAKFFIQIAPTGDYTIVTPGSPDQTLAGLVFGSDGGNGDSEVAFTGTTITFVAAGGASTIGDSCEVWCDGTNWYSRCFANLGATGITITG